ncbi:MAG TPA: hypothetical protein VFG68_12780 [Fimbriiglobus sp.]|nr:hypothetical protein [Fimbriiglobus sp.]
MSTPPTNTPEATARNRFGRKIDEAFEEASKLAGSSLPPSEFYEKFLNVTLAKIDAPAGVVWLRTPQGFLQMATQINLDQVGLDARRGGRQCHNEILRQVFQAQPTRSVLVEPQGRLSGVAAEAGAVPAANLTDYYALFAPIVNPDKSPLGLLEVFQKKDHDPRLYQTFLQYAVQMAGYASQYHQFANVRQASGLERVLTQIEGFAKLIHSSLNPTEVAYHIANEGRRLIECDRLCVGVRHGKKVTVEAVSGADVVEKASTHVRRMRALFDAVLKFGDKLVYRGTKDDGLPPDLSHALDDYLSESQPKLLVVTPVRDEREKNEKKLARSVMLLEIFNPPEQVEPLIARMDVVGKHAAGALYNAAEMKRVPFGFLWRPIMKVQEGVGGKYRFYWGLGIAALVLLAAAMVLIPYPLKLEAKGQFLPKQLSNVFAPYDGQVREILAKPGAKLKPNSPLVLLHSPDLQEKQVRYESDLNKANLSVQAIEQILARGQLPIDKELELIQNMNRDRAAAESARKQLDSLRQMYHLTGRTPGEYAALTPAFDPGIPRSSDDWLVLSGDVRADLLRRMVRQNEPLIRIANVDGPWRVELKLPQRAIGHVARALATAGLHKIDKDGKRYLDVDVLLTGKPDDSYPGRLYEEDLAQEAVPNKDDHNETESVVPAYIRVNMDDLPPGQKIPRELFVAGQEVHTRVRCGNHAMGYSLFHGVWEWFYEKVVFFF